MTNGCFFFILLSLNLIHDLWSYTQSFNCFVLKCVNIFLFIYLLNKTSSRRRTLTVVRCMYFMSTHSSDLRHNPMKWVLPMSSISPAPHYFKMRKPEKEVPCLDQGYAASMW